MKLSEKSQLKHKFLEREVLNNTDHEIQIMEEAGIEELDGELSFGKTTYEDGVQVFNNNKY